MTITIEEPDRKGSRKVEIGAGGLGPCKFAFAEQTGPSSTSWSAFRAALPAAA